MSDTRISAADLLRLAAMASVSPEGTADEVVAILQRTGSAEPAKITPITAEQFSFATAPAAPAEHAPQPEPGAPDAPGSITLLDDADSDKLAKPE